MYEIDPQILWSMKTWVPQLCPAVYRPSPRQWLCHCDWQFQPFMTFRVPLRWQTRSGHIWRYLGSRGDFQMAVIKFKYTLLDLNGTSNFLVGSGFSKRTIFMLYIPFVYNNALYEFSSWRQGDTLPDPKKRVAALLRGVAISWHHPPQTVNVKCPLWWKDRNMIQSHHIPSYSYANLQCTYRLCVMTTIAVDYKHHQDSATRKSHFY